jgi:hypothetical protein
LNLELFKLGIQIMYMAKIMTKHAIITDFEYINAQGHKNAGKTNILDVYYLMLLSYTLYSEENVSLKKMKLNNIVLLTCFFERI